MAHFFTLNFFEIYKIFIPSHRPESKISEKKLAFFLHFTKILQNFVQIWLKFNEISPEFYTNCTEFAIWKFAKRSPVLASAPPVLPQYLLDLHQFRRKLQASNMTLF